MRIKQTAASVATGWSITEDIFAENSSKVALAVCGLCQKAVPQDLGSCLSTRASPVARSDKVSTIPQRDWSCCPSSVPWLDTAWRRFVTCGSGSVWRCLQEKVSHAHTQKTQTRGGGNLRIRQTRGNRQQTKEKEGLP